jgi:glycosyltransferase involved in cell wall biosynthesis
MKKVLLVAYHYPPAPTVGAVRPAEFTRYLPEFGWDPVVLTATAGNPYGLGVGNQNGEVTHVAEWPHPLKSYTRWKEHRMSVQGRGNEFAAQWSVPQEVAMASPPSLWDLGGLKRWLLAFQWLPDQEIGWLIPAIWRGVGLVRQRQIRHMITTGPPSTCHLIGLALKEITRIRWIADFRDPWSLNHKYPFYRNAVTDRVEAALIRKVLRRADLVISNTPQRTAGIRTENPDISPEKFITLTNGFDPSDFAGLVRHNRVSSPVVFVHPGTFYLGRSPEPFLRALKRLIVDGRFRPNDVRVLFFGHTAVAAGQPIADMARRLGLEATVEVQSYVPRPEALQRIVNAHVVLVFSEHIPDRIPFKFYEALAAGTTILNIGSKGATSELLAKTGRGIAVDHTNQEEISQGTLEAIARSRRPEAWARNEPWRDPAIQEYSFPVLTGRLASLLETLT